MNRLTCLAAAVSSSVLVAGAFSGCGSDESGQLRTFDDAGPGGGGPRFSDASVTPDFNTSLGDRCQSDADCPGADFYCITNEDDSPLGGAPSGGMCVRDCVEQDDCTPFGALCLTVAGSETPDDPRDNSGVCLPVCFNNEVDRNKCQGRFDMACFPTTQPPVGVCQPVCGSDFDCPSGRVCDPGTLLCVTPDNVSEGGRVGAACDPDSEEAECQGFCLAYEQNGDFAACSTYCSIGSPGACGADPTATGQLDAFCFFQAFSGAAAPGDPGFCQQVCSCNEECSHPDAICVTDLGVSIPGVPGICVPPSLAATDAGRAGVACEPSSTPDGGADAADGAGGAGNDAGSGGSGGSGGGGTGGSGGSGGGPPVQDAAADATTADGG